MGRFLLVLLVLVVLVAGLGFYLDWFELSRQTGEDRTQVTLQINKDKVEQDTEKAVESAKESGRRIKESAQELVGKSIKGEVVDVDAAAGTLRVDTGTDEPLKFNTQPDTKVKAGDQTMTLEDVSAGQTVTIAYHEDKNGARIAEKIAIEQP